MADAIQAVNSKPTFEKILVTAMGVPGVKIDRAKFLRKELIKYCPENTVAAAIRGNPAKAGISKQLIGKISKQVINYESTKVTGLSVAASLPGGVAAVGAAMADITSYFAFILRTVQELAYLYGFEQFDLREDDIDSETMNFLLLFLGVMFGVQGASSTLMKFANTLATHIATKLPREALTKYAIYRIIKEVASKVGIKINKQIFADSVASAIPILGGVLSGGLTLAMFRPCCMKLRKNLASYNLCDPDYYRTIESKCKDVDDDQAGE